MKCKMQIERSSSLEFRNNLASLDKEWTWMHKRQHWQDNNAMRAKNSVVWGWPLEIPRIYCSDIRQSRLWGGEVGVLSNSGERLNHILVLQIKWVVSDIVQISSMSPSLLSDGLRFSNSNYFIVLNILWISWKCCIQHHLITLFPH